MALILMLSIHQQQAITNTNIEELLISHCLLENCEPRFLVVKSNTLYKDSGSTDNRGLTV